MIKYTTTTSVGVANKDKKESLTAVEYSKNKHADINDVPTKITFINVLNVVVNSGVNNREQMQELITSIYPDMVDLMGDSEKIGLAIKIGNDTIKLIVNREDEFDTTVRRSIMREYVSLIELPSAINKSINNKNSVM